MTVVWNVLYEASPSQSIQTVKFIIFPVTSSTIMLYPVPNSPYQVIHHTLSKKTFSCYVPTGAGPEYQYIAKLPIISKSTLAVHLDLPKNLSSTPTAITVYLLVLLSIRVRSAAQSSVVRGVMS